MASAAIIHVDGNKATNGDGEFWNTAYNNLQSALDVAVAEDQIWVRGSSSGITYKPGTARTSTFTLKSGVKIYGGFAGTETPAQFALRDPVGNLTVLSGEIGNPNDTQDNCHHVVSATGPLLFPSTVLEGFTITGGSTFDESRDPPADFRGGGILIKVLGNGEANACRPIIARCVVEENNSASDGGGAAAVSDGLASPVCEPWFVNCEFRSNTASGDGGGLMVSGAGPTLMNAIVHDNTAGVRGGGTAVRGMGTAIDVLNSTYSDNHAGTTGGLAAFQNGSIAAANSIFWGNTDESLTALEQISYADGNYCCIEDLPGDVGGVGNIDLDPLFVNAATGDFRLSLNSPCVDAGLSDALPPDIANIDADGGGEALSETTPLDFGLVRRVSFSEATSTDPCAPDVVDMGAHENGDCDGDGTRDEDEVDSNGDGIPDDCQDCNENSVLDPSELEGNDCNENSRLDECDIELGCSFDANTNGLPDECECPIDVVFLVDSSGSMNGGSGGGGGNGELEEVCTMISTIEAVFASDPSFRFTRLAPNSMAQCMTVDLAGYGLIDDEPSHTCSGPIGAEDMMNAIEVVAAGTIDGSINPPPPPLWRTGAVRIIVSITDEGGPCISPCNPSHQAVMEAIDAANSNNCYVFAISGVIGGETPECAEVLANVVVGGTCAKDRAWHAEVEEDFNEANGIGDQLIVALANVAAECLCPCPADLDGDRIVGSADLAILLGQWGSCSALCCTANIETTATPDSVGSPDLAVLLGAWGDCACPAGDGLVEGQFAFASGETDVAGSGALFTPASLAEALGFSSIEELSAYLGTLDFESMQSLLETYLGG